MIQDNSAFLQDTTSLAMQPALWNSFDSLGDGNFSGGDSSAPAFAWLARQLDTEYLLRFGPPSARLINPKQGSFVDPSIPTRFRFLPSPVQRGQFTSADVVMMVDLPLVDASGKPFPTQPGASSNGKPVLIRNRTFDQNCDINAANALGKGWVLERATMPANCVGFAVSGDRNRPVYYAFDGSSVFTEKNGVWNSTV